jgi:hypothetical protein
MASKNAERGDDEEGGRFGDDRDRQWGEDAHDSNYHRHHHHHRHDEHNGHDHSGDPPCYCRGTSILTDDGEVRVEDLAIGDNVVTGSGEPKPIKWIGRRSYAGRFIAGNDRVLPVVVRACALAPGIPARDLWLSPGHALLLDGVLVPVEHLVNALNIVQADAADEVDCFHLEFEAHEIVLAEAAPAESYVECDNRQGFQNAHEFAALYPDDARVSFGYRLPRLEAGMPQLSAIRARLFERAATLGYSTTADPDLQLVVDGDVIPAQPAEDGRYIFNVDGQVEEVWLASRCGVPAELELLSTDRRRLGVCIDHLVLRDEHLRIEVSHSHRSLSEGFHEPEDGVRRWTNGMGRLPERLLRPFIAGFTVEVHCLPPMPRYCVEPPATVRYQLAQLAGVQQRPGRSQKRPPSILTSGKGKSRAASGDRGRRRLQPSR